MNASTYSENIEAIFKAARCRQAEVFFNGGCLLRVICSGSWRKAPFFVRNLLRAIGE